MPILETLPLTPSVRQWQVWGTTARVVVTDPALADRAKTLVEQQLAQVDAACSRFREDSELARAQREIARGAGPVAISPLLADLVGAGLDAAAHTGGDVDPTLAEDLSALGYDRDYAHLQFGKVTVHLTHRVRHDWREVVLHHDEDGEKLDLPAGAHLDLGATAKAFTADRCARLVADQLGCGVLVSLGGDLAMAGQRPAEGWQVLVQDGQAEPSAQVSLLGGGLATSSTLSRTWTHGTRHVHHILDPETGRSADPVWRTVSVVAGSCLAANMLATASVVRGWAALEMLRTSDVSARLVDQHFEVVRIGAWPAPASPAARAA